MTGTGNCSVHSPTAPLSGNAHQALDKTVALAYRWDDYTPDMPGTEILQRLLQLNLARADRMQD